MYSESKSLQDSLFRVEKILKAAYLGPWVRGPHAFQDQFMAFNFLRRNQNYNINDNSGFTLKIIQLCFATCAVTYYVDRLITGQIMYEY